MNTTLHYFIEIASPRENVRNIMLQRESYEQWTQAFSSASTYEWSREKWEEITFVDQDEQCGMSWVIVEHIPQAYISIEHHAEFEIDMETGELVVKWYEAPYAYENYRFVQIDWWTRVEIEQTNFPEEYKEMFDEIWPAALLRLKALCENWQDQ